MEKSPYSTNYKHVSFRLGIFIAVPLGQNINWKILWLELKKSVPIMLVGQKQEYFFIFSVLQIEKIIIFCVVSKTFH